MTETSCTTANHSQGLLLHNRLTTPKVEAAIVGAMAKRTLMNPHGLHSYGAKRQPKRPHYLRQWVERRGFETDAEFATAIGADKSVVSRWLDEEDATTPGVEWQAKLGVFFGSKEHPADIFRHPDEDWLFHWFRDKSPDQIDRAKKLLDAAFPEDKQTHKNR
jgi:hypothetical protein